jgi:TPR repeat protein
MKIKAVPYYLSLVSIIFLSGCASAPPPTGHPSNMAWYQPGVSAEQIERDLAACQYYAMVNAGGYSVQGDTVGQTMLLGMFAQSAQQSRENQMVQTRMTALGYSLVKTNSPLLIDSQPTQATPQQREADRKIFENAKAKAENGDAKAQTFLGDCYSIGKGVPKDEAEAVKWWLKSAEQNDVYAQCFLGLSYYNGEGVRRNYAEAFKWLLKAAEQNNADAQDYLGVCFNMGNGVPQDYVEAYKWYNLASAQGNENAKTNLAIIKSQMTPEQIAEGQRLSREFRPRKESTSNNSISSEYSTTNGAAPISSPTK